MRHLAIPLLCAALSTGRAQAVVIGEVVLKDSGRPLEYTTVGVLTQGRQFLTNEQGKFGLGSLPPGELRLRFRRIGFTPHDTTLILATGDTARIRIEMIRLVIQLPEMLVSGKCTDETPREPVAGFFAQLMDQVRQNAETMALLVAQKPFQVRTEHTNGCQNSQTSPTRPSPTTTAFATQGGHELDPTPSSRLNLSQCRGSTRNST